jgi:amino acid adenylation domain-containing protein
MSEPEKALNIVQDYLTECRRLNESQIRERAQWNTMVTADAIHHMALGISDDNPLWLDVDCARENHVGKRIAPPSFLCSVLYPVLHGSLSSTPLSSLIVELGFKWDEPIVEGDSLTGTARQIDAIESRDKNGIPLALISSEVEYRNGQNILVGRASAMIARAVQMGDHLRLARDIYEYDPDELLVIGEAQRKESRRGNCSFERNELSPGDEIPTLVRGPLSIGDMIGWLSATGPAYRPGSPGYRDTLVAPHSAIPHPLTGWPTHKAQHHEDHLLASLRGMPAPFDHGVMRFAWITPLITNWMGNDGWLQRLNVRLHAPILYGDTTWYHGKISRISEVGSQLAVTIDISGVNQLGETTTTGEAVALVPVLTTQKPTRNIAVASSIDSAPDSSAEVRSPQNVRRQFAEHFKQTPNATAVAFDGVTLSYSELDKLSDTIAIRLLEIGLKPRDRVCICLPRSIDWIVSILGIVKAGGTFVPLSDSEIQLSVPPDQILMISDILHGGVQHGCTPNGSTPDDRSESISFPTISPADPAYIVFTSGTTGTPNGVIVSHGGLGGYIEVMQRILGITDTDNYLHAASFSFSASMRQVFVPLCAGATLVIANETQRRNPSDLFDLMRVRNVSVWDTVPSVFRIAVDTLGEVESSLRLKVLPDDLRLITLTGEKLDWVLPLTWKKTINHRAQLVNLYSHSETAGTVSSYPIPDSHPPDQTSVSLGRPVDGCELYILDSEKNRVPPGEAGEIWVSGVRLADGYLDERELTLERFVEDPSSPGRRMYRTGDVGRIHSDGELEFTGRIDDRVNIRGHRVEPADVAQALLKYPSVSQVFVSGSADPQGEIRLVAYLVADYPITRTELREFLATRLPVHMSPSVYVYLESLPINANGKLNRSELPEPDWSLPFDLDQRDLPQSQLDILLAHIWCDVLGITQVGLHDHFLDVGGDSISLIRLLNRIRDQISVSLSMSELFNAPTVSDLAQIITAKRAEA